MRVRILKTFAGDRAAYSEGDEVSLPDEAAVPWIRAGLVQRIPDEPRTAVKPAPEMAVRRK